MADKTIVYDVALSTGDNTTFVTFELTVTNFGGDPIAGVEAFLQKKKPADLAFESCSRMGSTGGGSRWIIHGTK